MVHIIDVILMLEIIVNQIIALMKKIYTRNHLTFKCNRSPSIVIS